MKTDLHEYKMFMQRKLSEPSNNFNTLIESLTELQTVSGI